jgi:hypothetical protein
MVTVYWSHQEAGIKVIITIITTRFCRLLTIARAFGFQVCGGME